MATPSSSNGAVTKSASSFSHWGAFPTTTPTPDALTASASSTESPMLITCSMEIPSLSSSFLIPLVLSRPWGKNCMFSPTGSVMCATPECSTSSYICCCKPAGMPYMFTFSIPMPFSEKYRDGLSITICLPASMNQTWWEGTGYCSRWSATAFSRYIFPPAAISVYIFLPSNTLHILALSSGVRISTTLAPPEVI